jgi:hypothetical protein
VVTTGTTFYFLLFVGRRAAQAAISAVFHCRRWGTASHIGHHTRRDRDQGRCGKIPRGAIMEQAMSLKDVARLLAVPAYRIEYRLAQGRVPEPSLRIAGRRVFSSQDLANLAASLGVTLPTAEAAAEPVAEPVGV